MGPAKGLVGEMASGCVSRILCGHAYPDALRANVLRVYIYITVLVCLSELWRCSGMYRSWSSGDFGNHPQPPYAVSGFVRRPLFSPVVPGLCAPYQLHTTSMTKSLTVARDLGLSASGPVVSEARKAYHYYLQYKYPP